MMNESKYPKEFPILGTQTWVDSHSIIFTNGGSGTIPAGKGSASLGKHKPIGSSGFCVVVVEVVEGPVYTHPLEYEFSYTYLMIEGIFH